MRPNRCPICDSEAFEERFHGEYYVACSNTRCKQMGAFRESEADAVIVWNMLVHRKRADSVKIAIRDAMESMDDYNQAILRPALIKSQML